MAPLLPDLRIHIIGAGMGGAGAALACAKQGFKDIHVWEAAPALGEVGAGINIPPNLARVLDRWGVLKVCTDEGIVITHANVLDCESDELLTTADYSNYMEQNFGYPFTTVHRSALQKCLMEGCKSSGVVNFHLGNFITEYDFDNTRFQVKHRPRDANGHSEVTSGGGAAAAVTGKLAEGGETEWIDADVIICADGIKSKARAAMMARKGEVDEVEDTGQAAYRIMVRRSAIDEDPELVPFFTGTQSYRWIGEKRHIIAYPIERGDLFNMSTTQPDRHFVEADTWTAVGSKDEMLKTFHDFCPRVQKLLNLVPEGEVLEWKLRAHKPLPHWIDGKAALVGDACHPTLPHIAQGAAMAVEDAAALGVILAKVKSKDDIHRALLTYQNLRKPRTDWAVLTASDNSKGLHTNDKEARNAAFRNVKNGGPNPDKMISREIHDRLFLYDVEQEAAKKYDALFAVAKDD